MDAVQQDSCLLTLCNVFADMLSCVWTGAQLLAADQTLGCRS